MTLYTKHKNRTSYPTPLLFDNCIIGECNMGCEYCRPQNNIFPDRKRLAELQKIIRLVSIDVAESMCPPILKMSGYGEIFLLPDISGLISELSSYYKHIQLATNLTLVNEQILSNLGGFSCISLCVSLDGHTPEMNGCRRSQGKSIEKICKMISVAIEQQIGLEIYSTLTVRNTRNFVSFVEYIHENFPGVRCYPFPVRGYKSLQDFGEEAALSIEPLVRNYSDFGNALPPIEYLKRLIRFIKDGYRSWSCSVALANIGIDPAGRLLACACGFKKPLASILSSQDYTYNTRKRHPIFKNIAMKVQPGCKKCFAHYEMINLLIEYPNMIKTLSLPWLKWEDSANVISNLHLFCDRNSEANL